MKTASLTFLKSQIVINASPEQIGHGINEMFQNGADNLMWVQNEWATELRWEEVGFWVEWWMNEELERCVGKKVKNFKLKMQREKKGERQELFWVSLYQEGACQKSEEILWVFKVEVSQASKRVVLQDLKSDSSNLKFYSFMNWNPVQFCKDGRDLVRSFNEG